MRGLAVALAVGGGLLLAAGSAADWVRAEVVRDVGGVAVVEVETRPGTDFAPGGVRDGLLGVGGGLLLTLTRGRARQAVGAALTVLGGFALAGLVSGWSAAAAADGSLTAAATVVGLGAIALTVGGLAGIRASEPRQRSERYTLEGEEADPEWRLAGGDDDEA